MDNNINSVIIPLFGVLMLICKIDCQICTKREVFTTQVHEFRSYTYLGVRKRCDWYNYDPECGKPQIETGRRPIILTKRIVRNIPYCCDGYVRTDSGFDNERIDCKPSCVRNCVNGHCDRPGQCSCYDGYKKDPSNQHQCVPICIDGCEHGICKQPNVCECNSGYQNINGVCSPVCSEPCLNGSCVAPDICDCLSGYRKSEANTCDPYCYSGCEHGSCVAPETCICDHGWFLNEELRCASFCDQECVNSKCVPQYNCECLPGYELAEGGACKAICKNCQGSCIGPYNCQCDLPFVAINYAANDTPCDCFSNCTDEDVECERTVCVKISSSVQIIIDDEATDTTSPYIEYTDNNVELSINTSINEQSKVSTPRFQYNWTFITLFICLLILMVILVYLVISKWKYLLIYFKGSSYIVEDVQDVHQSSQFVNVPLSDKTAADISTKSISKDYCITTT